MGRSGTSSKHPVQSTKPWGESFDINMTMASSVEEMEGEGRSACHLWEPVEGVL